MIKSVQVVHPIHTAQLLSYRKMLDVPIKMLVNFHDMKLIDGVDRMLLTEANREM
ncbi:MAG: hypothetical protein KDA52_06230 [Planctomycetaceae bacterium]|nr:hypothetical protein [Planctomycetaceae bacterium]